MFKIIIETAVRFRWAVVFAAAVIAVYGLFQLGRLPVDGRVPRTGSATAMTSNGRGRFNACFSAQVTTKAISADSTKRRIWQSIASAFRVSAGRRDRHAIADSTSGAPQ